MNKLFLGLGLAAALAVGALGYLYKTELNANAQLSAVNTLQNEALERAAEASKRDRQVLVARQAEIASTARKLAQSQRSLSEALQRNNSWSDTHVPDEVQRALGGP